MQQQFKLQKLAEYEVYTSKDVFINCILESLVYPCMNNKWTTHLPEKKKDA